MATTFCEEIARNQFYQYNVRSKFLDGCYTYDWNIDGQNIKGDTFKMIFKTSDGSGLPVAIKKAILIGKDGHQHPLKKILNEPEQVVYEGKLPIALRANARVRYWRPDNGIKLFGSAGTLTHQKIAERILVIEEWPAPTITPDTAPSHTDGQINN